MAFELVIIPPFFAALEDGHTIMLSCCILIQILDIFSRHGAVIQLFVSFNWKLMVTGLPRKQRPRTPMALTSHQGTGGIRSPEWPWKLKEKKVSAVLNVLFFKSSVKMVDIFDGYEDSILVKKYKKSLSAIFYVPLCLKLSYLKHVAVKSMLS